MIDPYGNPIIPPEKRLNAGGQLEDVPGVPASMVFKNGGWARREIGLNDEGNVLRRCKVCRKVLPPGWPKRANDTGYGGKEAAFSCPHCDHTGPLSDFPVDDTVLESDPLPESDASPFLDTAPRKQALATGDLSKRAKPLTPEQRRFVRQHIIEVAAEYLNSPPGQQLLKVARAEHAKVAAAKRRALKRDITALERKVDGLSEKLREKMATIDAMSRGCVGARYDARHRGRGF
ncbi:MAG: hypothetical protein ABSC13_06290 [Dehalococcoidia bacterium]|jgi:hypothetical protein